MNALYFLCTNVGNEGAFSRDDQKGTNALKSTAGNNSSSSNSIKKVPFVCRDTFLGRCKGSCTQENMMMAKDQTQHV